MVALSALKVAGEEGGGWTRSFARDAGRRGAGHNIDVMWYYCPALLFEYRVKQKNDLKQHRANVHDIDVPWHDCPEHNCSHKAKQESNIKQHRASVHGISSLY